MTRPTVLLRVLLIVLAIGVLAAVGVFLALQSPWGEERLARLVEAQAERSLDGEVSIRRVHGNLLRGATVEGLTITREGQPLIAAERVQVRYDAIGLARGGLAIQEITLVHPVVHLVRGPDGITLFDLLKTDPAQVDTPPRPYSIDRLNVVGGQVLIGSGVYEGDAVRVPEALNDLHAELAVSRDDSATSLRVAHLSFVGIAPELVVERLNGSIRLRDDEIVFDEVALRTDESALTLDGSLRNLAAGGETR